jgi:hypothetical protein
MRINVTRKEREQLCRIHRRCTRGTEFDIDLWYDGLVAILGRAVMDRVPRWGITIELRAYASLEGIERLEGEEVLN